MLEKYARETFQNVIKIYWKHRNCPDFYCAPYILCRSCDHTLCSSANIRPLWTNL